MSHALFWPLLFAVGHLTGALLFYFFHRCIFHGSLGKYPILKQWKRVHTKHHADPEDPGSFFFPWWANIMVWTLAGSLVWLNPPAGLGLFSFFGVYSYRHRKAHLGEDTRWARHHMSHHYGSPRANFSGTYPVIDKALGSYREFHQDMEQSNLSRKFLG